MGPVPTATILLAGLTFLSVPERCVPLDPGDRVLAVLAPTDPGLARFGPLARALIADGAPFALVAESETQTALSAETGLRDRRAKLAEGRALIERAREAFGELEAESALSLVTRATPLLVQAHAEPGGIDALARAHLLAGAVFLARGAVDASARRLGRALDLDPDISPAANLRLIGALETARAARANRPRGRLEVELVGAADRAQVFLDGRPLGPAPGTFLDVPSGRHVLRVAAPRRRSFVRSVQVEASRPARITVSLPPDPAAEAIVGLGPRLAAGLPLGPVRARLAARASARRTLVSALVPATRVAEGGGLAPALILDLDGAGRARVDPLDRDRVARALERLARCETPALDGAQLALPPALVGPGPRRIALARREPEPKPRAWMWWGLAAVAVGVVGGLAALHGSSAPPEEATIRLVPRP